MVLFDVIHVGESNKNSNGSENKSFLSTGLEVFCLGKLWWKGFAIA